MSPGKIRAARRSLGLTQAQLAAMLGYARSDRVSEIERGIEQPSAAVRRLLQAYLDGYRPVDWPQRHDTTKGHDL
jgi:transcriptional regulator with XRE-family HTH domain